MALNPKTNRPPFASREKLLKIPKIKDGGGHFSISRGKRIGHNNKAQEISSSAEKDPVSAALQRGRKAWKQYRADREYDRDAVYLYLEVVFDIVQQWTKKGMADQYSLQALKQHEFRSKIKADPYARVIYCTSEEDDPKKRSKWAKVMQWVATSNKKGETLTEYVKRHGGLNQCAESAVLDLG